MCNERLCRVHSICNNSDSNTTTLEAIPIITVINRNKTLDWNYKVTSGSIVATRDDHLWVSNLNLYMFQNQLARGDLVDVKVDLGEEVNVNYCGIHLVLEQVTKSEGENSIIVVEEE